MMILVENALVLATMEEDHQPISNGYVLIEDSFIKEVGSGDAVHLQAEQVIDATNKVVLPGFINTHHHLFQTLTRAYPPALDAELFDWLVSLYPVWARLDQEAVRLAALIGMAELMLSGCTTTTDHHYLFPRGQTRLIDVQIEAARAIGMRFHPTRGSMSLSQKDGGLPPDSVVQEADEILRDSERVIDLYHDPQPGAMTRIGLAPCSPFSVTPTLLRETARLARDKGVRLHTHLAETKDEEDYCLQKYGVRPVDLLENTEWMGDDVWLAHGIYFSDDEVVRLGQARVGIAHCPSSNMRLGSGVCRLNDLRRAGCPVGLGVDGSASNDSSHVMAEVRQALLLTRLIHGASAMKIMDALHLATVGGAACLGREDIGTLTPGKAADMAIFALDDLGYSGAGDPLAALLLCQPTRVDTLMINGRIVVEGGALTTLDINPIIRRHRQKAQELIA
ncbi:MAG: 8-oxoguanine deaminase [Acidobacteria bacterium]|nr:8-oxoguanine deaminase [Acidobacteriota bacterium]